MPAPRHVLPAQQATLIEELRDERDRFVAFAFAAADILFELDEDGAILFVDGATSGLLGHRPGNLLATRFLDLIDSDERAAVEDMLQHAGGHARMDGVRIHLCSIDKTRLPFHVSGFQLPYLKNHTFLSLSILRSEVRPEDLNKRDFSSGLLKRETFAAAAADTMREAQESGRQVQMTLLDFPELSAFLDNLDPQRAKQLLRAISEHLRGLSVGGDAAGLLDDGAFGLVHDATISTEQVKEQIAALTRRMDPRGVGIVLQAHAVSLGAEGLDPKESANALLYTINTFARARGEDFCLHSLSESYDAMLTETVEKIGRFKETVAGGEFMIAFQPIVDLKSGLIHHYESLVRLNNAQDFANPFHFVTFGEQTGLIGEFDLAMCQRTLEILDEARVKKRQSPIISVNLSGRSLDSGLFRDSMRRIMGAFPKVRQQIIFEITESAKINDLRVANDFVQEFRGQGNLFCLDDFGAGESSFDYLRALHVDFVKIDGSYVKESLATARGQHLLRAMATLCKDLGIVTIGEMVEDEKVARLLWESGVRFGQGYLFGKPTIGVEDMLNKPEQTPFHKGMLRARRISSDQRKLWAKPGG